MACIWDADLSTLHEIILRRLGRTEKEETGRKVLSIPPQPRGRTDPSSREVGSDWAAE